MFVMFKKITKIGSKKMFIFVAAALAILATVIFVKFNGNRVPAAQVQTPEEISEEMKKTEEFNTIAATAASNDNAKTIEMSKTYARNLNNGVKSRLDMYRVCMQVASKLQDNESKDECYKEAIILTDELIIEEEKAYWKNYIEIIYSGKELKPVDDGSPQ